eukprot:CAMPEP_0172555108 /NCGR_PEP_ID=MMETSP1067-20121228/57994_1 /TAXON_ID=265564 ORGANISM="Thalassiosira punctigera, Strain Tpunct2005C2" /NCGR_SAMPLE_ID=MMETSP1067 /ASSEMBLY_ACC=CAM_ASM_000444 /LENGTH=608 /DNA_ID=CAMNT_0013343617 /DNA_START=65 /DNA_END=1888 /DNA_ORIENTATION=+
MNGATDVVARKKGREARSRKKKYSSGNGHSSSGSIGNGGANEVSDSGDSRRSDRMAMRKKRVHRAKARKTSGGRSSAMSLCLVSTAMFAMYLLVCIIFFRNLPGGGGGGMKGLVKRTKEKVSQLRAKHSMRNEVKKVAERLVEIREESEVEAAEVPAQKKSPVPVGVWPISIRDEEGNFEEIKHPGIDDGHVTMDVPRFWAEDPVAIHENKLMSRERALSIGTCITPDPKTGSSTRGDECPLNERTVFVAIASYRDWQCVDTVTSIFSAAKHPERIRVAVVDQIVAGEDGSCDVPRSPCGGDPDQPLCLYKNQIDVFQMEAELAVGPVFARHLGHRLYRGEYYSMQSDAHVTFTRGWDVDIISQIEATGDEMAVLSTYLTDIVGSIDQKTGLSLRKTRPIMCNTEYEGGAQGKHLRHLSQPEGMPDIHGMPQLQPYWAAGYSFSRGHFIAAVPYDLYQPMIFQGEEMSIGLRGFTIGYDFFAPEKSVCFHSYAKGVNAAARNKVPHFWEHSEKFSGTGVKAMKRLLGIVNMNPEVDPSEWNHAEEARYGLGGVRKTSKFYELYGIDVKKKTTQRHLCQFVRGRMHNMFMKHLRSDGMGIDYSKIDFKW